jgi:ABC-type transporter Mla subunit MlaD
MRYVELKPGPRSGPPLPEGGLLTQRDTITPVEFDDVPRVFGPRTRRHMARMLKNAGAALDESGPDIDRFLEGGAPGTQGVADLTEDLATDPQALRVFIAASAAATSQIARNRDRLGPLLRDATTTMDTLVARSGDLGRLLKEAPGAFTEGQRVLAHLNRTSGRLERLSTEFAPGAKGMRRLAPIANRVTDSLADTAPDIATLLRDASRSAPPLTRFLERGDADLPTAGKALGGLTDVIGCLRPYAPEIAGYLSTTMGAHASYDADGHYIRLGLSTYPTTIPSTQTPEQVTKQFPNLNYGLVRPPGQNVDQPWFQPQCGVTPQGLDPAADEEAKR